MTTHAQFCRTSQDKPRSLLMRMWSTDWVASFGHPVVLWSWKGTAWGRVGKLWKALRVGPIPTPRGLWMIHSLKSSNWSASKSAMQDLLIIERSSKQEAADSWPLIGIEQICGMGTRCWRRNGDDWRWMIASAVMNHMNVVLPKSKGTPLKAKLWFDRCT